jgi:hypothetical protein
MTIDLTDKEMDLIASALMNLPWGQVNPLMVKIAQQVALQEQPPQGTLSLGDRNSQLNPQE